MGDTGRRAFPMLSRFHWALPPAIPVLACAIQTCPSLSGLDWEIKEFTWWKRPGPWYASVVFGRFRGPNDYKKGETLSVPRLAHYPTGCSASAPSPGLS